MLHFGDHYFATAGPTLWNSLPEQLQQLDITLRTVQTIVENVCLVSWAMVHCV